MFGKYGFCIKKLFEALVENEEQHFDQYGVEIGKPEKIWRQLPCSAIYSKK